MIETISLAVGAFPMDTVTIDGGASAGSTLDRLGVIGGFIQAIFGVIGVIILVGTVYKVVKHFAKGDMADALKAGLFGLIAAVLCLRLEIPLGIVDASSGIVERIGTSISKFLQDTNSSVG